MPAIYWGDPSMMQINRFIGMHAISFVHFNMLHMTNWVLNGLPERFPKLKVIWIESGLAWVPFLMQRLDSEYLMRSSEAPLLKRRPSEYMREMFFTTQPLETSNLKLTEATSTRSTPRPSFSSHRTGRIGTSTRRARSPICLS